MRKVIAIARTTYRESIRSKVLYSLFFFALLVVLVSAFFGTVTIGDQVKVVKDFGLFSISFFSVAYAAISGSALLFKELSRKTVYNILAKPVRRWEFLYGKYLGMLFTITLMLFLMGPALMVFTYFLEGQIDFAMLSAYLGIFYQLVIVCACAIFFSSIVVTPLLSGAFTFGVFLAGRSTEYLLYFLKDGSIEGILAYVLQGAYWLLPHLDSLELSNEVVYGIDVQPQWILWGLVYSCGYAGVMLSLAALFFQRREFN